MGMNTLNAKATNENQAAKKTSCCSPEEQQTCCEPEAKATCCAKVEEEESTSGKATCGCR